MVQVLNTDISPPAANLMIPMTLLEKIKENKEYSISFNGYCSHYDEPFYLSGSKQDDDYDITYYMK